jgi:hypothetical protein
MRIGHIFTRNLKTMIYGDNNKRVGNKVAENHFYLPTFFSSIVDNLLVSSIKCQIPNYNLQRKFSDVKTARDEVTQSRMLTVQGSLINTTQLLTPKTMNLIIIPTPSSSH